MQWRLSVGTWLNNSKRSLWKNVGLEQPLRQGYVHCHTNRVVRNTIKIYSLTRKCFPVSTELGIHLMWFDKHFPSKFWICRRWTHEDKKWMKFLFTGNSVNRLSSIHHQNKTKADPKREQVNNMKTDRNQQSIVIHFCEKIVICILFTLKFHPLNYSLHAT